jgi:endonuclease/exonuclease/phosphatase family metal-dependent hydrolase
MRSRHLLLLAALAGALFLATRRAHQAPLRIATFNIECFGGRDRDRGGTKYTDEDRLRELIGSLDADVVAVQEIESPERLERLAARLGGYRTALSRCGGASGMRVGFLWRPARVALDGTDEFPELDPDGRGRCERGERPGLLGRFRDGDRRLELLTVHLAARADEEHQAMRRAQWRRALQILGRRRAAGAAVGLLGDTNSTGFSDEDSRERRFIDEQLAAAGLELRTRSLGCSEYFRDRGQLRPSMLDHVALSPDFPVAGTADLRGYCAEASCRPLGAIPPPRDYADVSDHCPVVVGGK